VCRHFELSAGGFFSCMTQPSYLVSKTVPQSVKPRHFYSGQDGFKPQDFHSKEELYHLCKQVVSGDLRFGRCH